MALKDIIGSRKFNEARKVHIPCDACNADCCKPIAFNEIEIRKLWRKYGLSESICSLSKVGRTYLYEESGKKLYSYHKLNKYNEPVCIFKNEESCERCVIYPDRPEICKAYGETNLMRCAYENMAKQPESKKEQNTLTLFNDGLREELFADVYGKAEEDGVIDELVTLMDK